MRWKNNSSCVVMISVNLDAEFFWLSLSPDCINRPKTMLMGQYGMLRGLPRILDLFDKYNIKATFFTPGKVAEKYPEDIKEIVKRGHEIGFHGYEHENFALMTKDEQKEVFKKGMESIKNILGDYPKGFRAPEGELTKETLELVKENGFTYSSNLSNDDCPYIHKLFNGNLVEIPIHWALFDFPYFAFNYRPAFPKGQGRISNYTQVLNNWKNEYIGYHKEGLCYVLQLDPQTIGTPGRIGILEELFEFILSKDTPWFATGSEIEKYITENNSEK